MEKLPLLQDQRDRLTIQAWVEELRLGVEDRMMRTAFRIEGPLDQWALREALLGIRSRHSALRVGFPGRGAQGFQFVSPEVVDPLDIVDFPDGDFEQAVALLNARIGDNDDLDAADVFRARLVRLSEKEHLFGISVDHLIADGQSLEILTRELWQLYEAYHGNNSPDLAPVVFNHEDFSRWEKSWLAGEEAEDLLERAGAFLNGIGPNPGILLDGAVLKSNETYRLSSSSARIDSTGFAGIKSYAASRNMTPFNVMFSLMMASLAAHSSYEDLGSMIPVTRRATPEMLNLVSFISSYTTVPARLQGGLSFDGLTNQVRGSLLDALEIGLLPGPTITERLTPEMLGRLLAVPSLFFDLTEWSFQADGQRVADLALFPIDLPPSTVPNSSMIESLEITGLVESDGIQLEAVYPADVYPEHVISSFLGTWVNLSTICTSNPAIKVADIQGLSK